VGTRPQAAARPTEPGAAVAGRSRLDRPLGCAVQASGELLVADAQWSRIVRVTPEGGLVDVFGPTGYKEPNAVAVDPSGAVYVADTWNQRVQRLSPDGTAERTLPPPTGGFYAPRDVAVSEGGDVFLANTGRGEILRYDASGNFVAAWGSIGSGPSQLREPTGVAIGGRELYVADFMNARIQVFSFEGQLARAWPVPEWQNAPAWHRPGIAFYNGTLYASSPVTHAVLAYGSGGEAKPPLTAPGIGEPGGLCVSPDGSLFVSDPPSGRIVRLSLPPAPKSARARGPSSRRRSQAF
jgi:tripartite motif-containing protein 71